MWGDGLRLVYQPTQHTQIRHVTHPGSEGSSTSIAISVGIPILSNIPPPPPPSSSSPSFPFFLLSSPPFPNPFFLPNPPPPPRPAPAATAAAALISSAACVLVFVVRSDKRSTVGGYKAVREDVHEAQPTHKCHHGTTHAFTQPTQLPTSFVIKFTDAVVSSVKLYRFPSFVSKPGSERPTSSNVNK